MRLNVGKNMGVIVERITTIPADGNRVEVLN
jgi:hypothetical protein